MSAQPNDSPPSDEQPVDAVIASYLEAMQGGGCVDREAWITKYPEFAAELREFFANQDRFSREAGPLKPSPAGGQGSHAPTIGSESAASPLGPGVKIRYFGDYELLEEIARGGMGVVYKARQVRLKRVVALKMILTGQLAGEQDVARFHAEAQAAAKLDHPGIVPVFEVGEHSHQHYFSMAFVEGESLARKIAEGPLPAREAALLLQRTAEATAYAHVEGVIHRDLKPGNILIDKNGAPRITDFGLAKRVESEAAGLTTTGQVLGTPSYMPPEQARGDAAATGPLADVYSLGAVLYCALTGRPPFQAASAVETLIQVMAREPALPRQLNASVPRDLETICLKCLEKEPNRRYSSAREVAAELQRFLDGRPILARPISTVARSWRWCRRNAPLASTVALAVLLLIAISGAYFDRLIRKNRQLLAAVTAETIARENADAQRRKAEANAAQALLEKERADENAKRAADETVNARKHLYVANMNQAQSAWETAEIGRLRKLLQDQEPTRRDKSDYRDWEWNYWKRTMNGHRLAVQPFEDTKNIPVRDMAWNDDGSRMVGIGFNDKIYRWNVTNGELLATNAITAPKGTQATLSPDGSRAAVYYIDNHTHPKDASFDVAVWDTTDGRRLQILKNVGKVAKVAFGNDAQFLLIARAPDDPYHPFYPNQYNATEDVAIWNVASGERRMQFKGKETALNNRGGEPRSEFVHIGSVYGAAFNRAGTKVLTVGGDAARIWDAANGEELAVLPGDARGALIIGAAPDIFATASKDDLNAWNDAGGKEFLLSTTPSGIAYSPDGKWKATISGRTIQVWDTATGTFAVTLKGHIGRVLKLAFGPHGELASLEDDGTIKFWDVTKNPEAQTLRFDGIAGWQLKMAFDPTGRTLSAIGPRIINWEAEGGSQAKVIDRKDMGYPYALSADGKRFARVQNRVNERIVEFFISEAEEPLRAVKTQHTDYISNLAFSPDGSRLATISQDKTIKLWNVDTGEMVATWKGYPGGKHPLLFTPDGKKLIAAGQSAEILVLDIATKAEQRLEIKFDERVAAMAISRDGNMLAASSSNSNNTCRWDLSTGKPLTTLVTGRSEGLAFHPEGRRLATANGVDGVKLWDLSTGLESLSFALPGGTFNSVTFSPDGNRLAAASNDGVIKLWDATPLPEKAK